MYLFVIFLIMNYIIPKPILYLLLNSKISSNTDQFSQFPFLFLFMEKQIFPYVFFSHFQKSETEMLVFSIIPHQRAQQYQGLCKKSNFQMKCHVAPLIPKINSSDNF